MKLTAAQRRAQRRALRRARPEDLDPSEESGELNIVPFLDIVVNLMLFLLATSAGVMAIAQVEAQLPALDPAPGPGHEGPPALSLSVTLTRRGAVVATSGGRLAAGCEGRATGPAVSVPIASSGEQDWEGLSACLARIKAAYPEESEAVLSAEADIPYQDLIHAMDTLRVGPEGPLFEEVRLSAGVR